MRLRQELEEEKMELSAMLVHDLKSPLTVMCSGIAFIHEEISEDPSLVKKLGGTSGLEKIFKLLNSSMERLDRMVEDVLQLSKMEEMPGLHEAMAVDLSAMVVAASHDFELVAQARGQKISALVSSEIVPAVLGDPILLRRVLDNLIYNAIEHTPSGGKIQLAATQFSKGVKVSVRDSGPGIPKEARKDIFKKFFQKEVKRHIGNVGLGLALCEKVVLRHGGTIGIEEAQPHGACFYFVLPTAKPV
jgi:signal transduction histidine kinase